VTTNQPLPEKCCAKCGFLYGFARRPANREDAIFDPDLLRVDDIQRQYMPGGYSRGVITSLPYARVQRYTDRSEKVLVENFTWAHTEFIGCYWRKFIHKVPSLHKQVVYDDEESRYVPIGFDDVVSTIRQDRSRDCDRYFLYHPGLAPKQHAEFQLEEARAERALKQEQELTKWSGHWQEMMHELERKRGEQETRWKEIETSLTKAATWLTVGLLVFAAIQAIAAVISLFK
jgi:hypothetical protein